MGHPETTMYLLFLPLFLLIIVIFPEVPNVSIYLRQYLLQRELIHQLWYFLQSISIGVRVHQSSKYNSTENMNKIECAVEKKIVKNTFFDLKTHN